jgi:hypothetical protein
LSEKLIVDRDQWVSPPTPTLHRYNESERETERWRERTYPPRSAPTGFLATNGAPPLAGAAIASNLLAVELMGLALPLAAAAAARTGWRRRRRGVTSLEAIVVLFGVAGSSVVGIG